jgi:hypothetical protein
VFRAASITARIPFWNFFNAMFYKNSGADSSESQLAWQVLPASLLRPPSSSKTAPLSCSIPQAFTSLAYGSKGALYFCYWTPTVLPLRRVLLLYSSTQLTRYCAGRRLRVGQCAHVTCCALCSIQYAPISRSQHHLRSDAAFLRRSDASSPRFITATARLICYLSLTSCASATRINFKLSAFGDALFPAVSTHVACVFTK